uniref:Uncharacterized protein n=1 Tax=Anguilla anguilla TaxID=7936 RepID=A0A0E9VK63_ANGAN
MGFYFMCLLLTVLRDTASVAWQPFDRQQ